MSNIERLKKETKRCYDFFYKMKKAEEQVSKFLKYKDFEDCYNVPKASMCGDCSLIVEWSGKEIPIEEAISIMEGRGYIVPEDFS